MGDSPNLDFWGGVKGNEEWNPVSITGATKPVCETEKVERYTIYCPREAYYIAKTHKYIFAVRVNVSENKNIYFTFWFISFIKL